MEVTSRVKGDKMSLTGEELGRHLQARKEFIQNFICPDCGYDLVLVPVTQILEVLSEVDLVRACTKGCCDFICFVGDVSKKQLYVKGVRYGGINLEATRVGVERCY